MGKMKCAFVTASLLQTVSLILIGIAFFAPYWLAGVTLNEYSATNTNKATDCCYIFQKGIDNTTSYPNRGLYAQCGTVCYWIWQDSWQLEKNKFQKSQTWHVATQALYGIGTFLIFFAEIYSRVQMCCAKRNPVYASLGVMMLISVLCQAAGVATFGYGANTVYKASYNPADSINSFTTSPPSVTVMGFCFWLACAGVIISGFVMSFYFFAACECHKKIKKMMDDDDDDEKELDDDDDD
jgi:hypothetical protein